MRYQTEIHVSSDRYVCLQLPTYFPEGKAVVTVTIESQEPEPTGASAEETDHQDIEWWDEFDEHEPRHFP